MGVKERLYFAFLAALVPSVVLLLQLRSTSLATCALCWYQAIAVVPLVALLGLALRRMDWAAVRLARPLILAGLVVAALHLLQVWGIGPAQAPCGVAGDEKALAKCLNTVTLAGTPGSVASVPMPLVTLLGLGVLWALLFTGRAPDGETTTEKREALGA